jgi:hypothetical protein
MSVPARAAVIYPVTGQAIDTLRNEPAKAVLDRNQDLGDQEHPHHQGEGAIDGMQFGG